MHVGYRPKRAKAKTGKLMQKEGVRHSSSSRI